MSQFKVSVPQWGTFAATSPSHTFDSLGLKQCALRPRITAKDFQEEKCLSLVFMTQEPGLDALISPSHLAGTNQT